MPRSIIRTVTIAIATAALAAPTALARPADMPPAVAKAAAAAEQHKQARLAQVRPVPDAPSPGRAGQPAAGADDDRGARVPAERNTDWTTIGLGITATLLVLAAIAGIVRHARSGRARVTRVTNHPSRTRRPLCPRSIVCSSARP